MSTIEETLGAERYTLLAQRITGTAVNLAVRYDHNVEKDDLEQQMWCALLIQAGKDPDFLSRPVREIVNKLAWRAMEYARGEFEFMNASILADPSDYRLQNDRLGTPTDQYSEADDRIEATWLVEHLLEELHDRPRTRHVAELILSGKTKTEAASEIGVAQPTITYHVNIMRQIVARIAASG